MIQDGHAQENLDEEAVGDILWHPMSLGTAGQGCLESGTSQVKGVVFNRLSRADVAGCDCTTLQTNCNGTWI